MNAEERWESLKKALVARIEDLTIEQNNWIKKYGISNGNIDSERDALSSLYRLMVELERSGCSTTDREVRKNGRV